ncbi:MAG: carbohydrate ABC transporter permease [Anaerolineae bacterium]|nr:carbohydrate ABC transporter permease [Anaerolineae bacterium]
MSKRTFPILKSLLIHTVLLAGTVIVAMPFLWMVTSSFKDKTQIFIFPPQWIPQPFVWQNYVNAWNAIPLGRFYLNSFFVAATVTIGQAIVCSMAAYVFARLQFPGRDVIFLLFLGTMMLPRQITLIPRFIIMKNLGWIDTYQALIIPFLAWPLGTFLLRQSFLDIPTDLEDAARMDGCSRFRILFQIILPLSKPALATVAVFSFMNHWNTFLWPLIVIQTREKLTLQVGLSMLRSELGTEWPTLMAASVLSALPTIIVYFFAQRQFVAGITLTGLKS